MKKSAFISDLFFTFFLVSIFTLCLFRYFRMTLFPALLLSSVCGGLATTSVGALLQNKRKSFFLKKSDEAQKQKLLFHLALLSDEQTTRLFENALKRNAPVKRFGKLRLFSDDAFYFLNFGFSPVAADEIASAFRLKTSAKKVLLCSQIEEQAAELCRRLQIEIKTGNEVYAFLKSQNALPETYLGDEKGEDKRKRQFRLCFSRSNSKRFFISGALVLLTSLITPFPYYYLIFGSFLLLVSALIRIFGYT